MASVTTQAVTRSPAATTQKRQPKRDTKHGSRDQVVICGLSRSGKQITDRDRSLQSFTSI